MANKETKTAAELIAIIMGEIRLHPELNDVQTLEIRPMERHGPSAANWDATPVSIGRDEHGRAVPVPVFPDLVYKIIQKTQTHFDLA
jgi:hypothetical protein